LVIEETDGRGTSQRDRKSNRCVHPPGLTRFLVLFLIDLSTRRVEIAGITAKANGIWMTQLARNFCDDQDATTKVLTTG
jgi:hypothetical protein